ncbi:insecticidal toxin complex protein TccC [Pseudomonas sp. IT-P44]|uniref:RHS repeat domain-containing protein n=1 Tax=Pseudomonas sp. IT-P44 TaxID=3026451 RepID=UPI0039DF2FEE
MAAAQWIDAHTPSLAVVDARGLVVRNVAYCRHPLNPSVDTRITRNHFDPAGRLFASWDPRLWGTAPKPNLENTFDLQGRALLVDSVDAGWQLSLMNRADAACSFWDGRGGQRHSEFDELQRPTAVTEQMAHELPRVSERFTYGDARDERAAHNQCGQPIRHDHPAGRRSFCDYGVGGSLLAEQTRFLRDLELPDWSSEFAEAELEDEVFETTWQYGPVGEMHCQTDAMDNVRSFAYDRAGQLRETRLKLAASLEDPRLLVSEIRYDAFGRGVSERAGNGVTTIARYAGEDGRLLQLQSCDVDGKPLQNFSYGYDPVGNITFIEDLAQLTRYFNNQRIDPVCRYGYDSLYQLTEAIGSEVSQPSYGPALPTWQTTPLDPNQLRNYTQTFNYDAAGNLQTRHHSGAETFEMFTATGSNRSAADKGNLVDGFDANGNQLELLRGQKMSWDVRNQLSSVTMVKRDDGPDDTECYCYDSPGHRLRKVRLTLAAHRTLRSETRYLPGLEIHRDKATGEERHVVSVEAGRGQVRALHWVDGLPRDVRNDQLRFCLSNHLNSSTLELDEQGRVLSREVYYAFGGTALWAGVSEIEARYKTIRYSGKERDAAGLYYYGYRYYAPWLQRWVSPDPLGRINGLNIYNFVGGRPVLNVDIDGRYDWEGDSIEHDVLKGGDHILARGLKEFSGVEQSIVLEGLKESIEIINDAIAMLKEYPQASESIQSAFLGPAYEEVVGNVVKGWGRTRNMLANYQAESGQSRFVKIKAPDGVSIVGYIMEADTVGRMFLNENNIEAGVTINTTILHEASHLPKKVEGMPGKGASTVDYWSFPLLLDNGFSANTSLVRKTLDEVMEASRQVMRGESPDFFSVGFIKDRKFFTETISEGSENSVMDFRAALDEFNGSADVRGVMGSNNADTSTYLAYALHVEYQKRLNH